ERPPGPHRGIGVHVGRPAAEVRRGRLRRDRLRPVPVRGEAHPPDHRPRHAADGPARPHRRPDPPLRHDRRDLRRRPRRADRRLHEQGHRLRHRAGPVGRVRRGGRRVEHRHGQGRQPADDLSRRPDGLHQQAGGQGPGPARPAQAADRRPHHGGHRVGVDGDVHPRRALAAGEDRHQPRAAAPDAGRRRPAADDDAPARGHGRGGDGHRVPRARVLHGALVRDVRTQEARGAGDLQRLQPRLRPVVREVDVVARTLVPHRGGARRGGRRRPDRHDDGGDLRRHGLRQLRGAHPARQRLPDRRAGAGLPPGGLSAGRADGAARHVGVADRAGGVPVQLRGGARPAHGRGQAARAERGHAERRVRAAAARGHRADARHPHPQRDRRGRLRRGRHPRPGGRDDEAAAAAGHLPEDAHRGRPRGHLPQVDPELV
ncbi:MAG: Alcohol dehydrogenase; Adhfe1 homolog, partial [uncultured Actinomycetospora sp.]